MCVNVFLLMFYAFMFVQVFKFMYTSMSILNGIFTMFLPVDLILKMCVTGDNLKNKTKANLVVVVKRLLTFRRSFFVCSFVYRNI